MKKIFIKISTVMLVLVLLVSTHALAANSKYSRERKEAETFIDIPKIVRKVPINDVYAIHFILDGTNLETFNETLNEGKLPTIKKRFVKNGSVFKRGLSAFPSTSGPVYQSYTTGLLPGHAGISHLQRFDRQKWQVIDYLTVGGHNMINTNLINLKAFMNPEGGDLDTPTTIFELLEGHPTAAIYSSFQGGASITRPDVPLRALWSAFVSGREEHVDVLAYRDLMSIYGKDPEEIPRYSLVGLYSSDIAGHKYGPKSKKVVDVLVQFDNFLAKFIDLLKKQGIYDKTYIILTADHGMHETGRLFKFKELLIKRGVYVKPKNPQGKGYTLFTADRGIVSSHIYVKHDGGFEPLKNPEILRRHPLKNGKRIDLIEMILGLDATDFLIVRAGDRNVRIYNYEGRIGNIECTTIDSEDYCSYSYRKSTGDPLGYSSNKRLAHLLDGMPHSTFAWRDATANETYPDAVIQLSQIFEDEPPIHKMIDVPRFVREDVYPKVKASSFSKLNPLARQEMRRRARLVNKLKSYLEKLKSQKGNGNAKKIVDKRYLDDHIDITKRSLNWARRGLLRMEDIAKVTARCKSASSVSCMGL